MNPHVHVPTPEELEAAKAGKLPEVWVEFKEQSPEKWTASTRPEIGEKTFYAPIGIDAPRSLSGRWVAKSPIQPGDTVVLGEEWIPLQVGIITNSVYVAYRDGKREFIGDVSNKTYAISQGNLMEWQPAATMPADLARFRFRAGKSTPEQREGKWGWVVQLTQKELVE